MNKALSKFEVYALYEDGFGYFDIRILDESITIMDIRDVSLSVGGLVLERSEVNHSLRRLHRKLVCDRTDDLLSYKVEFPPLFAIDIKVYVNVNGRICKADWACERLSLDFTYTPNNDLFRKRFTFKSGRHAYRKTVRFIAENNLNRLEDIGPNIAVSSYVINGYSALELAPTDLEIQRAFSFREVLHSSVEKMKEPSGKVSSRDNRTSMLFSMMVMQAHCELLLGRYTEILNLCQRVLSLLKNKEFYLYHAMNTSKTFLMAAILARFAGVFELESLAEEGVGLVKISTLTILKNLPAEVPKDWVDEAKHALDVISATETLLDLPACQLDRSKVRNYLELATRVNSKSYLDAVVTQFA